MKQISIVLPCYNEAENVAELYKKITDEIEPLNNYGFELMFIDNASEDGTVKLLKEIALKDKRVKIIVNARNFGWIRSPYYGLTQPNADAVILMATDLQDPPELIGKFIEQWENGYKIVAGVKTQTEERFPMSWIRKSYYAFISSISETRQIKNFTGFGLYDHTVIEILRKFNEPYPYLRGLVAEIGYDIAEVEFMQPTRKKGTSYGNFFRLYDAAALGVVNHSKITLRIATFIGLIAATVSLVTAIIYFVYKLLFWSEFQLGMAPLVIGVFFFSAVQLLFIGVIGEYIGAILTQVKHRPLVIEKERVNFD